MKLRGICILLLMFSLLPAGAQTNKRIKALQEKHGQLQKQITETEKLLRTTKKNVGSQLNSLNALTGQINERKRFIETLNSDLRQIDDEIGIVEQSLKSLQADLQVRKDNYTRSLRHMRKTNPLMQRLMFIFSADNLAQSFRRLRYVREYAFFQREQAAEIEGRQNEVVAKRQELDEVRASKTEVIAEREAEKKKLETQENSKRLAVRDLQKKQKSLQNEINKKRKEINNLNAQIDKLVAAEIEKAHRQAEAENKKATKGGKDNSDSKTGANVSKSNTASKSKTTSKNENYTLTKADQTLSANFVHNKGKLPMPITTSYIIVNRFGQHSVEGLKNVMLDNKGIDIQGQNGAKARAVFNGKVAAVFQLNGLFNVLVRHGAYISVYCNLASTNVKTGDNVSTKQVLGDIFADPSNDHRAVLHFQLRKERDKLNPEQWLNR